MQKFVKEFHTTGLVWNAKGVEAKSLVNHGVPPPPPPPPPANLFDDLKIDENAEDKARNALFDDLNKGEGVTSGLKKVTDDMKTHKNPSLRGSGTVPAKSKSPSPAAAPQKPAAATVNKPPKFELEGKKWAVEFH